MKRSLYRAVFCLAGLLFVSLSLLGCEDEYLIVTFRITGTGLENPGDFSGYYILDDGDIVVFDDEVEQVDSYTFSYKSPDLDDFDTLEVYVRRKNYDADIILRIYEDGEKVQTNTLVGDDDEDDSSTDYILVSYDYPEDEDDDSDDDDDDDDS